MANNGPQLCLQLDKRELTTGQVAKLCKVAPRTVAKWCDAWRDTNGAKGLKNHRLPYSLDRRIIAKDLEEFCVLHGMNIPWNVSRHILAFCSIMHAAELEGIEHADNMYDAGKLVGACEFTHAVLDDCFGIACMQKVAKELVAKFKDCQVVYICSESVDPTSIPLDIGGRKKAVVFQAPVNYERVKAYLQ